MSTCPRCGAEATPIGQDEGTVYADGSYDLESSVVGWRCENDHVLAAGDVVD